MKLTIEVVYRICVILGAIAGLLSEHTFAKSSEIGEQAQLLMQSLEAEWITFVNETFTERLSFRCLGYFPTEDLRQGLLSRSQVSGKRFQEGLKTLKKLYQKIENYEGTDWEKLYGSSGLWNEIQQAIARVLLYQSRTDFWLTISGAKSEQARRFKQIMITAEELNRIQMGRGELLWINAYLHHHGQIDEKAERRLGKLIRCSECPSDVIEQARLFQSRFAPINSSHRIKRLFEQKLEKQRDFAWCLEYAFARLQSGSQTELKQVLQKWPQSSSLVEMLVFYDTRRILAEKSNEWKRFLTSFTAELAGRFILKCSMPQDHRLILKELLERYNSPVLFAAAGHVFLSDTPHSAAEFLLQAAKAYSKEDNSSENALRHARQAAVISSNAYWENPVQFRSITLESLLFYLQTAGAGAEPQIQYTAANILNDSGMASESRQLLELLKNGDGLYSYKARIDLLLADSILIERIKGKFQWEELVQSINANPDLPEDLAIQALAGYIRFLLDGSKPNDAEHALQILDHYASVKDEQLLLLKTQVLVILGRNGTAASILLEINPQCVQGEYVLSVLQGCLDKVEVYTLENPSVVTHAIELGRMLKSCLVETGNRRQIELVFAEFTLLEENLSEDDIEKIQFVVEGNDQTDSLEQIRCRARLRMRQNQWLAALTDWQQIRKAHEPDDRSTPDRSWFWWRAKYFELLCYSKLNDTDPEELNRILLILFEIYPSGPKLWIDQLATLKK